MPARCSTAPRPASKKPAVSTWAILPYGLCVAGCSVAAGFDARLRKIPNAIPIALALCGLALAAVGGWREAAWSALAGAIVLVAGTIPFGFGWIGGGDVKLLAACACALGASQTIPLIFYSAIVGGAVALVALILRRLGRADPSWRVPYAFAILGGAIWLGAANACVPQLKIL